MATEIENQLFRASIVFITQSQQILIGALTKFCETHANQIPEEVPEDQPLMPIEMLLVYSDNTTKILEALLQGEEGLPQVRKSKKMMDAIIKTFEGDMEKGLSLMEEAMEDT